MKSKRPKKMVIQLLFLTIFSWSSTMPCTKMRSCSKNGFRISSSSGFSSKIFSSQSESRGFNTETNFLKTRMVSASQVFLEMNSVTTSPLSLLVCVGRYWKLMNSVSYCYCYCLLKKNSPLSSSLGWRCKQALSTQITTTSFFSQICWRRRR